MKKVFLCVLLVFIGLCPLFAKVEFGVEAGTGCEVFIIEKLYPAFSFGADAEIPNIQIDENNNLALVVSYDHIFRSMTIGRTNMIDSDRITAGVKYTYRAKNNVALSAKAAGGIWFFDYSEYKYACTIVHTFGLSFIYNFNNHLSLEIPVDFSTASFGNSISASIALNVK